MTNEHQDLRDRIVEGVLKSARMRAFGVSVEAEGLCMINLADRDDYIEAFDMKVRADATQLLLLMTLPEGER